MNQKSLEQFAQSFLSENAYNRPIHCEKCGGIMVFIGVGEYRCEDCKAHAFDDYGKVRAYVEEHKGATAIEVESATGVSQKAIRNMLREDRLEVTADSKSFLHCEVCGVNIRSGKYCQKCRMSLNKQCEDMARVAKNTKNIQGIGLGSPEQTSSGAKRFKREF